MRYKTWSSLVAPLRQTDFLLLWCGQTVSLVGQPLQTVALIWLVLHETNSPLILSGALLALQIPFFLLPLIGGVITDAYDPRLVILWSDGVRIVTASLLGVLALINFLPLWLLYPLLVLHGIASGTFTPAFYSVVPRIMADGSLQNANALLQLTTKLSTLIGAPLAGLLVATINPSFAFFLNALSYVIAVLATLQMLRHYTIAAVEGKEEQDDTLFQRLFSSFTYVQSRLWLMVLLAMDALIVFATSGAILVGVPLLAQQTLHVGAPGFGLLLGALSGGEVLGIIIAGMFPNFHKKGLLFCLLSASQALIFAGLALALYPLALISLCLSGLLSGVLSIIYLGLLQTAVEKRMIGRVMSLSTVATFGLSSLSPLAAGILVEVVSIPWLFLLASSFSLLVAIGGLFAGSLYKRD